MFSVSGEFLTERARDLVLSGAWREGLEFLKESLDADYDVILEILKGNKKLIGTTNLEIVEEDRETKEHYQKEVEYIYLAGRLILDNKRFKVYGYVREASSEDIETVNALLKSGYSRGVKQRYSEWWLELGRLFMYNKNEDEAIVAYYPETKRSICALFEKDYDEQDIPFWLAPLKDVQKTLDLYGGLMNLNPSKTYTIQMKSEINEVKIIEPQTQQIKKEKKEDPFEIDLSGKLLEAEIEEKIKSYYGLTIKEYTSNLRESILKQIENNNFTWEKYKYVESHTGFNKEIVYPVELMLAYTLSKTNAQYLMPNWKTVSESGIKMDDDNPFHTDAWIACGFDLNWTAYSHKHPDNLAFYNLAEEIQKKHLGYESYILNSAQKEEVNGVFRTPETFCDRDSSENTILVVPHAGEEFELMFLKSSALICEQGGKLAHLVIIGRELNIPIIRDENALKKYKSGLNGTIDLVKGKIQIKPENLSTLIYSQSKKSKP